MKENPTLKSSPNGKIFSESFERILKYSDTLKKGGKFDKIESIQNIKHIVFVGSSLCGKSTLIDKIKEGFSEQTIIGKTINTYFPKRMVIRKRRSSGNEKQDNIEDEENLYLTDEEFKKQLENGTILSAWERGLDGKITRYGFINPKIIGSDLKREWRHLKSYDQDLPTIPINIISEDSIIIYSANNAFVKEGNNMKGFTEEDLDKTLFIGVTADDDERLKRYKKRNPELVETGEGKARMDDKSESIIPNVHITINTTEGGDKPSKEILELINKIHGIKEIDGIIERFKEATNI